MPTTYAHWYFGQQCLKRLPNNIQKIINENINIYNIGVHGPDILFYYLSNKQITEYGVKLHHTPACQIFEMMKNVYHNFEEKDAMLSYILGFLTHFALDSTLHSYVERKRQVCGISHNLVEAEYDAHCIRLNNKRVNLVDRAKTIKCSNYTAKVISHFYPFTNKQIKKSISYQRLLLKLMNCKTNIKRKQLKKDLTNKGLCQYSDLIMEPYESDICKDSNLRLDKLREKALELYPELFDDLISYINKDKELTEYFDHDFEKWTNYNEIPVLNYEEEINYIV